VTTLTLAEPLTATLLALVVLGERPTPVAWSGAALIAAGLVVVTVRARRLPS
jgi:DME family drug/metabolite transporter